MVNITAQTTIDMSNHNLGLWSETHDDSEYGVSATATEVHVAYNDDPAYTGIYYGTFNPEQFGSSDDGALVNTLTGFTETNSSTGLSYSISGFFFDSLAAFNAFDNAIVLSGADLINASGNNDFIRGYGGTDSIFASGGNDTIYGGLQRVDSTDGADEIHGGDGADEIYGNAGSDLIYGGGTGSSADSNDLVYGGQGNDTIYGNQGDDELYGGGDVYSPNDVADTVYGGQGNDRLYGNGGNDVIYGNAGDDWMHGGADADTFVFGSGDGNDTLGKFVSGEDIIQLQGGLNNSGIQSGTDALAALTYSNGNAVLDLGGGNSLTIENVSNLTAADFVII